MDLHKKMGEMLYSTLKNSTMEASRLQASGNNIQSQLKLEKISFLAKRTKIKSLDVLVIKLGYDLSNVKSTQDIIKRENVDISILKKQLQISIY